MVDSTIAALWVPVICFSHLFAFIWFLKLYQLNNPTSLGIFKKKRNVSVQGGSSDDSEGVELEIKAEDIVLTLSKQPPVRTKTDTKQKHDQTAADVEGASSKAGEESKHVNVGVERVSMDWQRLGCQYKVATGIKIVLNDIWGQANPGEMQALLGPSGAGKSTLMDILAQRKAMGNLTGAILINGKPVTRKFIKQTAYVPQDDNFIATMTTQETMRFYADIVLPQHWGRHQRRDRVAEVLGAVGLASQARTLVGGHLPGGLLLRGLSGGERKRLSIAAGILAAPSVIFLDEPTSGLDSFAALTVMGYLKCMARDAGHVVISSIHQPRSAIWSLFDKVTLLASGRLMYHGSCDHMLEWFTSLGYPYDPNVAGVASDWVLDLVAIGFQKPKHFYGHTIRSFDELQDASAQFVACYKETDAVRIHTPGSSGAAAGSGSGGDGGSMLAAQVYTPELAQQLQSEAAGGGGSSSSSSGSQWRTSWGRQFGACLGREYLSVTRNPADVAGRTLTFTWVAILMGLLYYSMPTSATSIQGRLNLLFNTLAFFCLMPYVSMSLYAADKRFYVADASAKLYRPHAYYAAKVMATTPFQIISSCVFTFVVYGMSGLRDTPRAILQNGCISTLLSLIAVQVLHCCAILAPNQDAAFMLSIVWTAIQLLMSNFFIPFNNVLFQWITHLRWLSALYYAFEGLAVVEFGGVMLRCNQGLGSDGIVFLRQLLPKSKFLNLGPVVSAITSPGEDCVANADAVLQYFGFTRDFGTTVGILFGYLVGCHICTYMCMLLVAKKENR